MYYKSGSADRLVGIKKELSNALSDDIFIRS